jgi:hypothetical protein
MRLWPPSHPWVVLANTRQMRRGISRAPTKGACVCVCVRQLPTNCAPRQPAANHSGRPPAACLHQAASFQPLAPSPRQPLTAYSRQPTAVARAQTNWQPPTSRKPPHSSPAQVAAARVPALPPITGRQATVIRDAKSWRLRGG